MTFFGFLPVALETMKMLQDNLLNTSLGVDTVCVTGGSVRFPVHSFVLASGSETLAKQIKFAETLGPTVLDFQVGLSFSGFLSGFFFCPLSLTLTQEQTALCCLVAPRPSQIKFAETLGPTVLDFQVGLSFSHLLSGFFLSLYLSHLHTSRKLYAVFLLQDHRRSSLLRLANPS